MPTPFHFLPRAPALLAVLGITASVGCGCRGDRPPPSPVAPSVEPSEEAPGAPEVRLAAPVGRGLGVPVAAETSSADGGAPAADRADAGAGTEGVAERPPAALPDGPVALPVDGFESAVVVPPAPSFPMPAPTIVILHGNFDRPEWQCATWSPVGMRHGWLLCPRGTPRTDVDAELDRWTWDGPEAAARETVAALRALQTAWPGRVGEDHAVLVGFSLGARYAPVVAAAEVGLRFASLVLVEQGFAVTSAEVQAAREAGVERVLYVCGERTECAGRAAAASVRWKRVGAAVDVLVMEGVGHAYPDEFDPLAERVFEALSASP